MSNIFDTALNFGPVKPDLGCGYPIYFARKSGWQCGWGRESRTPSRKPFRVAWKRLESKAADFFDT